MHENQLLSPNRHPPRPANDHDGTILTTAPDRLWGTDASMVQTVGDGRVWVFAALDHFNSEVIGHYVSTDGSRFAALEPISQAVSARFRGIEADVARGVTVRADHGPQYISGHFTHQIAHWGMALSHSFPRQPKPMVSSSGSSAHSRSRLSTAVSSTPWPRSKRRWPHSSHAITPPGASPGSAT
jgi:transposase InsO family protein